MEQAQGVPQTAFVEDAARQTQFAQAFFYTLGDIFSGSDASLRYATGAGNQVDVAVDAYGQPYVRGTTAGLPSRTATSTSQPNSAALVITPAWLIAGAALLYVLTRRSK